MSSTGEKFNPRSRGLALACGGAIILAVGAMWMGQKQMKETTGQASLYKEPGPGKDQNMSSGQISDVVTNGSAPARSKAKQ